jgi:DeoR/GlpR family transcriptional regulator of sugar metabolism
MFLHVYERFGEVMQDLNLLTDERQALIEARLLADGRVLAAQLSEELGVSVDTIRRDLRELATQGRCRRVYGGALPSAPVPGNHQLRLGFMTERKRMLAKKAAELVDPGMTVYVDAGTTNLAAVKALDPGLPITLVTNAPAIAAFVLDRPEWRLIQIGGEVNISIGAAVGAMAIRDADALMPDLAILGTCGFDIRAGLSAHTLEEGELKRYVAERSSQVLSMLTDDKLSTRAPYAFCAAKSCNHLIFESTAPEDVVGAARQLGANVLIADQADV